MQSRKNYYKILQVDPSADPDMIQAAYQILQKKQQPAGGSLVGKADQDRPSTTLGDFPQPDEVEEAYNVLSDPQLRAQYDQERLAIAGEADKEQQSPGSQSPASESPPVVQPPPKMSIYMRRILEEQNKLAPSVMTGATKAKKDQSLIMYFLIIVAAIAAVLGLTSPELFSRSPSQPLQVTAEDLCTVYDFGSHKVPCTPDPRKPLKGEIQGKIMLADRGSDIEKAYQLIFPGLDRVWFLRDSTSGKLVVVYYTLQGDSGVRVAYPGKELPENIDALYREILSDQQAFITDRQTWFAQRVPTTTPSP